MGATRYSRILKMLKLIKEDKGDFVDVITFRKYFMIYIGSEYAWKGAMAQMKMLELIEEKNDGYKIN